MRRALWALSGPIRERHFSSRTRDGQLALYQGTLVKGENKQIIDFSLHKIYNLLYLYSFLNFNILFVLICSLLTTILVRKINIFYFQSKGFEFKLTRYKIAYVREHFTMKLFNVNLNLVGLQYWYRTPSEKLKNKNNVYMVKLVYIIFFSD